MGTPLKADATPLFNLADTVVYGSSPTSPPARMLSTNESPASLPQRGVFCTRELDLRGIKGIGYDMDYTLIDYKMVLLEERVYHYSKEYLLSKGFPVSGLCFEPELVVRGLSHMWPGRCTNNFTHSTFFNSVGDGVTTGPGLGPGLGPGPSRG